MTSPQAPAASSQDAASRAIAALPVPIVPTVTMHPSGRCVVLVVPLRADPGASSTGKSALLASARVQLPFEGEVLTVAVNATGPVTLLGESARKAAEALRAVAQREEAAQALREAAAILGIPAPSIPPVPAKS